MNTTLSSYLNSAKYTFQSFRTISYWRYALWKLDSLITFLSILGFIWLPIELGDYFGKVNRQLFPSYFFWVCIFLASLGVIISRRPLTKIKIKVPGKDIYIEVRIENIFEIDGSKVIGSNNTFDTDLANNIINVKSIQGQFTNLYYPQNIQQLDNEIDREPSTSSFTAITKPSGKLKKYEYGTTITLKVGQETFYLLAMAELNAQNVASTSPLIVKQSLDRLWHI